MFFIERFFLPVCLVVGTLSVAAPVAFAGMNTLAAADVAKDGRRANGGESPDPNGWKSRYSPRSAASKSREFPGLDGWNSRYGRGQTASQASVWLGLDERVTVHTDSKEVRDLIDFLAPPAWRVQYDARAARLDRKMVFHAETTRRRALDELCSSLGLKGIFYPQRRLILIVDKVRQ